jgi:polysaccharide pyruvyl transferase WcaK-like protein
VARVLVSGFFGRGNAGDEALLQCVYEALSPVHEVGIALHPADTHRDCRSWYPYKDCTLIDEAAIGALLAWDPDALLIGGGGLSPGFGAHFALTMRLLGRPTVLAGTDNLDLCLANPAPEAFRDYMDGFRYIGLRFEAGLQATRALGVEAALGADWAYGLLIAPELPPVTERPCAVIVRAWDPDRHDAEFRFQIHALVRGLRVAGYAPFLLPFSPEDEELAIRLAPFLDVPVQAMWWNPRAQKGVLERCALVVSVGRLHPLIFAAPLGVPVCHVAAPVADETLRHPLKITAVCRELGLRDLAGTDSFLAALAAGDIGPADPARVNAVMERLATMARNVLAALPAPARPVDAPAILPAYAGDDRAAATGRPHDDSPGRGDPGPSLEIPSIIEDHQP